jgi:hypothetical protein
MAGEGTRSARVCVVKVYRLFTGLTEFRIHKIFFWGSIGFDSVLKEWRVDR